jgi:hypothetical protein
MCGSAVRFEKCSFIDGAVSANCSLLVIAMALSNLAFVMLDAAGSSFDGLRTSLLCEFDIFITALFLGPLGRAAILSSSLSIPTNQYVFEHCFSDKQENIAVTR